MRAFPVLSLVVVAACASGPTPAVVSNPVTVVESGCQVPSAGRSLRSKLELERGAGTLTVDGKDGGACAVFALTPGEHQVKLDAAGEGAFGVAATLDIFADGNRYDLFELRCGVPGSCDTGTLRAWRAAIEADRTRMTDPCGAAKITNVKWESQQMDDVHPRALSLSFVLHVYSKSSGKAPHDPSCPEK
jgi:hypothetical protein